MGVRLKDSSKYPSHHEQTLDSERMNDLREHPPPV